MEHILKVCTHLSLVGHMADSVRQEMEEAIAVESHEEIEQETISIATLCV
jgi:hypothetical protein